MPAEFHDDTRDYYDAEDIEYPLDWLDEYEDDVKRHLATRPRVLKDGRTTYTVFHASQIEGLPASYGGKKIASVWLNDWLEFLSR